MFVLGSVDKQHAMFSDSSPKVLTSSAHARVQSAHMIEMSSSDEQHAMSSDSSP
jgi:hypothetical protein